MLVIGLEPIRCYHRGILSPLRLPIPPYQLVYTCLTFYYFFVRKTLNATLNATLLPPIFSKYFNKRTTRIIHYVIYFIKLFLYIVKCYFLFFHYTSPITTLHINNPSYFNLPIGVIVTFLLLHVTYSFDLIFLSVCNK